MLAIAKSFLYLEVVISAGWVLFYSLLNAEAKRNIGHFPYIIVTAFTFALFFSPAYAVLHAVLFLAPIAIARNRNHLLVVMMVGTLAIPGMAIQLSVGSLYVSSWSSQTTLGLGGLLALLATKAGKNAEKPVFNISLAIFLVLVIIIAIRGTTSTNIIRQIFAAVATSGVSAFVIAACLRSADNRRTALMTMAALGVMLAFVIIYESRNHWPLYSAIYDKYGITLGALFIKFRGGVMRAYGPLGDATAAGFALALGLAASLGCAVYFKRNVLRYVAPIIILVGILSTQSRGGMIGAVVVILGFSYYRFGAKGLGKAIAVLAPFAVAYMVRSQALAAKMADAQDTSDYRRRLFTRGMEEFWKNPILGDTMDHVTGRMEDLRQGEGIIDFVNSYLYFALATGFFGFIAFCIVLLLPMIYLFAQTRQMNKTPATGAFAAAAFASILSASAMLAFTSIPQQPIIITLSLTGAALGMRPPKRSVRTGAKVDSDLPPQFDNTSAFAADTQATQA